MYRARAQIMKIKKPKTDETSVNKALDQLIALIHHGEEFPDAIYTISYKFNVSHDALLAAYDQYGNSN